MAHILGLILGSLLNIFADSFDDATGGDFGSSHFGHLEPPWRDLFQSPPDACSSANKQAKAL